MGVVYSGIKPFIGSFSSLSFFPFSYDEIKGKHHRRQGVNKNILTVLVMGTIFKFSLLENTKNWGKLWQCSSHQIDKPCISLESSPGKLLWGRRKIPFPLFKHHVFFSTTRTPDLDKRHHAAHAVLLSPSAVSVEVLCMCLNVIKIIPLKINSVNSF